MFVGYSPCLLQGVAMVGVLPWVKPLCGGVLVRPILENSTACTMSNAKTRLCFM
jgi:hypothetical protein